MPFITGRRNRRSDSSTAGVRSVWRIGLQIVIATLGLAAIVGSGGGELSRLDPGPEVVVDPPRVTVQVGATVTFTGIARATSPGGSLSLQWSRLEPSGYRADIPGATGTTYTVVGANLADDGASFVLTAIDTKNHTQTMAGGTVAVSSSPGIVYHDGEFLETDWRVTSSSSAAQDAASSIRAATGGNPGAYRSVTYRLPTPSTETRTYHASVSSDYDPSAQGAVYVIDFDHDCLGPSLPYPDPDLYVGLMIEQAGRRYLGTPSLVWWRKSCAAGSWQAAPTSSSLGPFDFWSDDPGCSGPCRPDFSATAAPIRLGFWTAATRFNTPTGGTYVQGIDNWRVTIWRR